MLSTIDRSIVYPVSSDITEHDMDIVSDLWTMAGRQVFRGARDPTYTHANVYWLYDPEDLDRIGVSEHKLDQLGEVSLLWYKPTPFGTLLQEDGWIERDSIWSRLSEHTYEQFLTEGWTNPTAFLERCLRGSVRVITPEMVVQRPTVYTCERCNQISLKPFPCGTASPLTFPEKEKVWFIDDRMVLFTPPRGSSIWSILDVTLPPEPSSPSLEPEPELEQVTVEALPDVESSLQPLHLTPQ